MKISDLLLMCIRNLVRRKFMTFLTVIGVIIGTTSIIMMISLGIGISAQQDEQLKMWGDLTMIELWSGGSGQNGELLLNDEAVAAIQQIEGVDVATPFVNLSFNSDVSVYAGHGSRFRWRHPNLYGVYPEALEKLGYTVKEGEGLPVGKTKVLKAVFGGSAAYQFEDTKKKVNNMRNDWPDENGNIQEPFFNPLDNAFKLSLPPSDPNNKSMEKLEYDFEVTGILNGERNKWETMYSVFMSLEDLNIIQAEYNKANNVKIPKNQKTEYNQVKVKAIDINKVSAIEKAIHDLGFLNTWSMQSRREEMQKSMLVMQIILGAIGGITLFVSAISIANTMIMSVSERTREIGIMKVIGCLVGNIRTIFLVEASLIGLLGGFFGVVLSFALSFTLNRFGGAISGGIGFGMGGMIGGGGDGTKISMIPPWLVLFGLSFAALVGILAGIYPAYRAVKISALEAIKKE